MPIASIPIQYLALVAFFGLIATALLIILGYCENIVLASLGLKNCKGCKRFFGNSSTSMKSKAS